LVGSENGGLLVLQGYIGGKFFLTTHFNSLRKNRQNSRHLSVPFERILSKKHTKSKALQALKPLQFLTAPSDNSEYSSPAQYHASRATPRPHLW
jgi:hypothetical protein